MSDKKPGLLHVKVPQNLAIAGDAVTFGTTFVRTMLLSHVMWRQDEEWILAGMRIAEAFENVVPGATVALKDHDWQKLRTCVQKVEFRADAAVVFFPYCHAVLAATPVPEGPTPRS